MNQDEERKKNDFQRWEFNKGALECHIEKLQAEIAEYEHLTSNDGHTPIVLTLEDIYYFPQVLIKARIASKLKHYEDKDDDGATFSKMMGVFFVLDMKVKAGEFLVPVDTLRRTPMNKEDFLSKSKNKVESDKQVIG